MKAYIIELLALCCIICVCYAKTAYAAERGDRVFYSIKVIKTKPQMTLESSAIRILDGQENWEVLAENDQWQGENHWEIYFNIATSQEEPEMPNIEITAGGVKPSRVIVGNTDVPYRYEDGKIMFQLRNDKSVGQLIETYWKDPRDGLPIYLRHNWEMRKVGPWDPWPANAIRAVDNFLFAAREALRLMEKKSPGKDRFDGRIVLMGFETSSSRGHKDDPAHVHNYLKPHDDGGHISVSVYCEDQHICHVSTVDNVSDGKMKAAIKYAEGTHIEEILYDPFTGRLRQD